MRGRHQFLQQPLRHGCIGQEVPHVPPLHDRPLQRRHLRVAKPLPSDRLPAIHWGTHTKKDKGVRVCVKRQKVQTAMAHIGGMKLHWCAMKVPRKAVYTLMDP